MVHSLKTTLLPNDIDLARRQELFHSTDSCSETLTKPQKHSTDTEGSGKSIDGVVSVERMFGKNVTMEMTTQGTTVI